MTNNQLVTKVCDIAALPYESRPINRLISYGESALSSPELLSVILGANAISSIDTSNLMNLSLPELKHAGFTSQNAIKVLALRELCKRLYAPDDVPSYKSPQELVRYIRPKVSHLDHEEFHLLCFSSGNHLIRDFLLTSGTVNSSLVSIRETLTSAIRVGAVSAAVYHNHPSTRPEPSNEDMHVTKQLSDGFNALGITFLDHIIIGGSTYFSFKERGLL